MLTKNKWTILLLMLGSIVWAAEETTSVADSTARNAAPVATFELAQNYPNPFNPSTTIQFSVPTPSEVTIEIYDLLGNKVKRIVQSRYESGTFSINVNASDLAAGVYFYSMTAGDYKSTKRMTLIK